MAARRGAAALGSVATLTIALAATAAEPQGIAPGVTPGVEGLALLPGWRQADGSRMAAIEIRLAPGWHTYWRIPGEAGIPPDLDWSRSENLATVRYRWPRPQIFDVDGLRSLGHDGRFVLPVELMPMDASRPILARAWVTFGACAEICVPGEGEVSATIAPDAPPVARATIAAALASRPLTAAEAGVAAVDCDLASGAAGPLLRAGVTFDGPAPDLGAAVMETDASASGAQLGKGKADGRRLVAELPIADGILDRGRLRLTLIGNGEAVEITGCRPG